MTPSTAPSVGRAWSSGSIGFTAAPARKVGVVETRYPISFTLRAYVDLARLRRVLDDEFERRGLVLDERRSLVLAVHEAAKNALGVSDAWRRPVEVSVAFAEPCRVSIRVSDQGAGFKPPRLACPPPLTEEHGRGLCLITALVDSFTVERQGGRTVVCLDKRLSAGTTSRDVA